MVRTRHDTTRHHGRARGPVSLEGGLAQWDGVAGHPSACVPQPPQAYEGQHQWHEPTAAAEPGPHRWVFEATGNLLTRGTDDEHADKLDADGHGRQTPRGRVSPGQ